MTKNQLIKIGDACVKIIKRAAPYKTGNLRYNSIKVEIGADYYAIYIDTNIAPYMKYTNEPWTSDYWNGKKNPNEKWFDKVAEEIANYINSRLKGRLVKEE